MTLIVDANVLVSAVLGRSIDLLLDLAQLGVRLATPVRMMIEAQQVIARNAKVSVDEAFRRVALLSEIVDVIGADLYALHEDRARARLSARGQSDWPVLAASLSENAAVWSNDRDFFGVGVPVWSMHNIKHLERIGG